MQLLDKMRVAKSLADFVEGGGFASVFAEIGLQAAATALERVAAAKDWNSQIWSAINHLEMAEASLTNALKRHRILGWVRVVRMAELDDRRRYVRCILAVAYTYVGEYNLAGRLLVNVRSIGLDELKDDSAEGFFTPLARGLAWMANPLTYIDWVRVSFSSGRIEAGSNEMNEFESRLAEWHKTHRPLSRPSGKPPLPKG